MSEDQFSLFGGETPEQIRRRIMGEAAGAGQSLAGNAPGRGVVSLAGSLPGMLSGILDLGGQQKKARQRQEALSFAFDVAKDDPDNYYVHIAEALNEVGDVNGALAAMEKHKKHKLKRRELAIDEKKIDEKSRLQSEKLSLQEKLAEAKDQQRRDLAELEDLRKRELAGEDVKVDMLKIENDMKKHQSKMRLMEDKNDILRERVDVLRIRAGTGRYDAETRRMKLKNDKDIAALRAAQKEKGRLSNAEMKKLNKTYDSYEKFVRSKDLGEVVAKMVEDHPEAGGFFSGVDDKQMAKLIQGEMLDKIAKARAGNVDDFDFDRLLLETGDEMLKRWTTEGDAMFGAVTRPEMNTPMTPDGEEDLDAQFNELLGK